MLDPKKIKEWAEAISTAGTAVFKLGVAAGVVIAYVYCAYFAHFFPTGVAVGDSILFLFIVFTFGLGYLLSIGLGFLTVLGLRWPCDERLGKNTKGSDKWAIFGISLLFALVIGCLAAADIVHAYATRGVAARPSLAMLILSSTVSGFLLLFALVLWPEEGSKEAAVPEKEAGTTSASKSRTGQAPSRKVMVALALIYPILLGGTMLTNLVARSFELLGLSAQRAILIVDEKNLNKIEAAARLLKIPVLDCGIEGTDQAVVHNMRVLWHGVGDRSEVAFILPDKKGGNSELARLELDRDGLKVLTVDTALPIRQKVPARDPSTFEACLTLKTDAMFDSYADKPNALGEERLRQLQDQWRDYLADSNLKIVEASIMGYSDPVPVDNKNDNNLDLSKRRAQAVKDVLINGLLQGVDPGRIRFAGLGASEPKAHCPESLTGAWLTECLAVDRRVEVRLKLESPAMPQ